VKSKVANMATFDSGRTYADQAGAMHRAPTNLRCLHKSCRIKLKLGCRELGVELIQQLRLLNFDDL
jgi:hypothetical protein